MGKPANAETEIYDVLQAAVTVIWCISIAVLFIDVLIILRRYRAQFQQRRLAHPAVFWACSLIGGLASVVGIVATLSGSWTSLISNDAGHLKILGAVIEYGTWFWAGSRSPRCSTWSAAGQPRHGGGDGTPPGRSGSAALSDAVVIIAILLRRGIWSPIDAGSFGLSV